MPTLKLAIFVGLFVAVYCVTFAESSMNTAVPGTCKNTNPVFCRNYQRNVCDHPANEPGPDWNFFLYRNCFCDRLCAVYGDCCADYGMNRTSDGGQHEHYPGKTRTLSPDNFKCDPVDGIYSYGLSIYTVVKCPASWTDSHVRKLCESDRTDDIFLRWPVSGIQSGILYKNVFCSRCHSESDVTFWISNFTCNHERRDKEVTDPVAIISSLIGSGECFINFTHPTEQRGYRFCKPNVGSCAADFQDDCVKNRCEGNNSMTSYVYYNRQTIYKNSDCAYCNAKTTSLKCYDKVSKFSPLLITGELPPFKIYPLCLVLDLNTGNGHLFEYKVGQVSGPPITETKSEIRACENSHVYDPYTGKCRVVYCRDGVALTGNMCDGDCTRVLLNVDEYVIFSNGTLYAIPFVKVYEADEYIKQSNSTVLVCTDLEQNYTLNVTVVRGRTAFKFSETQAIVSIVGQIISVVALFVHFVVYSMIPSLRNLPGKNLMCLVFSLFWAQVLFMSGGAAVGDPMGCAALAALTHFFFLSSFTWMTVMSFDIWRTFASRYGHQDSKTTIKLFLRYSLFAWLLSFCIVIVSVVLDFSPVTAIFRPGYGQGVCWITSRPALFILFALPVGILLLINTTLYVLTIIGIHKVSKATRMVKRPSDDKRRLFLYAKLSTIMGLTWIFGFIAASTDNTVMWYIFIILNTLQGLFICLAFVCTKMVFKSLREICGHDGRRAITRSAGSSETKRTTLSGSTQMSTSRARSSEPELLRYTKPLLPNNK